MYRKIGSLAVEVNFIFVFCVFEFGKVGNSGEKNAFRSQCAI